ncbi:MAG: bifunctional folylpolyglutamate synthase/dihydrofolate synthase [Novosphingobium sp.]|nr:bifunctional folylpolyglutamate synthase/dihydrofolate synthase [Novosphingobium sp.]
MADKATSENPLVQAQLDRLGTMSAGQDKLGRSRLRRLLDRLGNPERHLAPVFHVAGTNGKGSVCAYLRAAMEAQGLRTHVFTSPHLVRLNERFRIANRLIGDAELAALLADVLDAVNGDETTFFEATTAAAFLGFARHPADACVIEVGLGGRLDATNVMSGAAVCGIVQLGLDHQAFLGDSLEGIAHEKAGIAKAGVPLVTLDYAPSIAASVAETAAAASAPVLAKGTAWDAQIIRGHLHYRDTQGKLVLPQPALPGAHQADNAGLAIAMLRHQQAVSIDETALAQGLAAASWPARLSRLAQGPLTALLPAQSTVWLDGAHNPAAMAAVIRHLRDELRDGERLQIVMGLLKDKDAHNVLACFETVDCAIRTVPIAGYEARDAQELADMAGQLGLQATAMNSIEGALRDIARETDGRAGKVLITGSLYLAGQVLRANDEIPQ